jgi:spore coat polysaccharide biosynthesis protein SpsF
VDMCGKHSVSVHRGSLEDVLTRFYDAARAMGADHVVRVTADCPLIDPKEIDRLIREYRQAQPRVDYAAGGHNNSYPRGMEAEIFSFHALEKAHQEAISKPDREHVTSYFYRNPEMFKVAQFPYGRDISHYRLTVDTPDDFQLISNVLRELYPANNDFTLSDVVSFLENNPKISNLNSHVRQKAYGE